MCGFGSGPGFRRRVSPRRPAFTLFLEEIKWQCRAATTKDLGCRSGRRRSTSRGPEQPCSAEFLHPRKVRPERALSGVEELKGFRLETFRERVQIVRPAAARCLDKKFVSGGFGLFGHLVHVGLCLAGDCRAVGVQRADFELGSGRDLRGLLFALGLVWPHSLTSAACRNGHKIWRGRGFPCGSSDKSRCRRQGHASAALGGSSQSPPPGNPPAQIS